MSRYNKEFLIYEKFHNFKGYDEVKTKELIDDFNKIPKSSFMCVKTFIIASLIIENNGLTTENYPDKILEIFINNILYYYDKDKNPIPLNDLIRREFNIKNKNINIEKEKNLFIRIKQDIINYIFKMLDYPLDDLNNDYLFSIIEEDGLNNYDDYDYEMEEEAEEKKEDTEVMDEGFIEEEEKETLDISISPKKKITKNKFFDDDDDY